LLASPIRCEGEAVILIVVRWTIKPDRADDWLSIVDEFTQATRAEPGNLFFDWSRSVDDPDVYLLVEAFADGAAHVNSAHFKKAMDVLPDAVASTPQIINVEIPDATGWSEMGEITPR
jgi:quinol monooxygenase YgiN